jgi:hypothetical protein
MKFNFEIDNIAKEYCKNLKLSNEVINAISTQDHLIIKYSGINNSILKEKSLLIHKSMIEVMKSKVSIENEIAKFIFFMRE